MSGAPAHAGARLRSLDGVLPKAVPLAEQMGHRGILVAATSTLGAAMMLTDYEAGCAHLQRALDMSLADGLRFNAADAYNSLGGGSGEVFRLRRQSTT